MHHQKQQLLITKNMVDSEYGIRVNSISPGAINTSIREHLSNEN